MSHTRRETVFRGTRFHVDRFTLAGRDGSTVTRELAVHPGAVVVLPMLDAETCVLIRNTRPMLGETLWELPAGTREPGEAPIVTAARELEEETGYRASTLSPLASFYASPGITDERMHAYVATGLTAVSQSLDATEEISVHAMPLERALAMCRDGTIADGKTLAILLLHASLGR